MLENGLRVKLRDQFAPHLGVMAGRVSGIHASHAKDVDARHKAVHDDRVADLLAFFADRLKVQLREQGARHDLVDAVFALEGQDDLLLIVRRVEALGAFLDTDDGKTLAAAGAAARDEASAAVAREDFEGAMRAMAKLRPAVDAFFDKVKVNDDDPAVRENRLRLLNQIRAATRAVADFSKIQE